MNHLVTINNNSSQEEKTNDSATCVLHATTSTVSTLGRGKNKIYEKFPYSI